MKTGGERDGTSHKEAGGFISAIQLMDGFIRYTVFPRVLASLGGVELFRQEDEVDNGHLSSNHIAIISDFE